MDEVSYDLSPDEGTLLTLSKKYAADIPAQKVE
jgi:hypothetical protein